MSHDSKILPVAYRTELGGYRVGVQTGYPSVESLDYNLVHLEVPGGQVSRMIYCKKK